MVWLKKLFWSPQSQIEMVQPVLVTTEATGKSAGLHKRTRALAGPKMGGSVPSPHS